MKERPSPVTLQTFQSEDARWRGERRSLLRRILRVVVHTVASGGDPWMKMLTSTITQSASATNQPQNAAKIASIAIFLIQPAKHGAHLQNEQPEESEHSGIDRATTTCTAAAAGTPAWRANRARAVGCSG
jgi:hypothetical protein